MDSWIVSSIWLLQTISDRLPGTHMYSRSRKCKDWATGDVSSALLEGASISSSTCYRQQYTYKGCGAAFSPVCGEDQFFYQKENCPPGCMSQLRPPEQNTGLGA